MREFDYSGYIHSAGIPKDAVIDVSSDMLSVAKYCMKNQIRFDPVKLTDALADYTGNQGTVLIRAFSWAFCKGEPFHMNSTRSAVGSLGIVAMSHDKFRRTRHPLYSWFVYGKHMNELCELDYADSFGPESVFAFLEKENAVQLIIGEQRGTGLTMGHYAEEKSKVPYRRLKVFKGSYYDEKEEQSYREYSMYVRPLNVEVTCIFGKAETQEIFRQDGIRKDYLYDNELPISTIDLKAATDYICNDYEKNDGKHSVIINGIPGVSGCGIDWTLAEY